MSWVETAWLAFVACAVVLYFGLEPLFSRIGIARGRLVFDQAGDWRAIAIGSWYLGWLTHRGSVDGRCHIKVLRLKVTRL